jgi:hypothetical protein
MTVEYRDLRQFIELVEKMGDLRRIQGAALEFEIGAITEVAAALRFCSATSRASLPGTAFSPTPPSARVERRLPWASIRICRRCRRFRRGNESAWT